MAISLKRQNFLLYVIGAHLGALIITLFADPGHALAASQDKEKWKDELVSAAGKMETFFSEVRASGVLKTTTKVKGNNLYQANVAMQRSGGSFKQSTKAVDPKFPERVYCRNPERYVFALERRDGESSFLMNSLLPKTSAFTEVDDILPSRFLLVSHHIQGVSLSKIMSDRSFLVKSFSLENGVAILKFEWSASVEAMPNLTFGSAEIWLSVENGWAIEKFRVPVGPRGSKPALIEGNITYDRKEDGVAVPKRIFESHGAFGTAEFVFDKLEHVASDAQDFTMSYYGLPEPMGMPPLNGGIRWYIWLALAAFGALGLGGLLQMLKRRFQSRDPVKL